MNTSQIHLALTHVPVVLTLAGMVTLALALLKNNSVIKSTAFIMLVVAGVVALPVFFSGEGAEEAVENLPGVSDSIIHRHESFAQYSLYVLMAAALLSLAGLFKIASASLAKGLAILVLLVSLVSSGMMAQTAHLGGQIRHTEIRSGTPAAVNQAENGEDAEDND